MSWDGVVEDRDNHKKFGLLKDGISLTVGILRERVYSETDAGCISCVDKCIDEIKSVGNTKAVHRKNRKRKLKRNILSSDCCDDYIPCQNSTGCNCCL